MNKHKKYSGEEAEFIKDNWDKINIKEIAKQIGRTSESVYKKAYAMMLRASSANPHRQGRMANLKTAKVRLKETAESEKKQPKNINPTAGKIPLRVDNKTVVYVRENSTDEEKQRIIKRLLKTL